MMQTQATAQMLQALEAEILALDACEGIEILHVKKNLKLRAKGFIKTFALEKRILRGDHSFFRHG